MSLLPEVVLISMSILASTATRDSVFKEWMKAVVVIGAVAAGTIEISLVGVYNCR